jgi:hemolysin D
VRELLARYASIWQAAWRMRHELAGPRRLADEAAFLPAALSLQETPVHPAPRRLAWALMGLFVIALAWSILGQVDIVAVAPGRIVVSDRTKVIQPLETSVVRRILVQDGDRVEAGQLLVELDATLAAADKANVQEQWAYASSESERTAALLRALDSRTAPVIAHADSARRSQLQAEWQDIQARRAKLAAELQRRRAEMVTVQETIAKLEATVPLARTREADYLRLVQEGYISGHATQDRTRERIELERDLATQRARLGEARLAAQESEQSAAAYLAETRRTLQDRFAQASSRREQLSQDQAKASQRERLTRLTAPVAGVVQQLAAHTPGGVVTEAQPLMVIVPEEAEVTAEVMLENKDIGFVQAGQAATIKLETFLYTRYGTVPATVQWVTPDAVTDEKRGAIFPARLVLQTRSMDIDGRVMRLTPGMSLTAEIRTGQRRVIEYLLSPIQRAGQESLRER